MFLSPEIVRKGQDAIRKDIKGHIPIAWKEAMNNVFYVRDDCENLSDPPERIHQAIKDNVRHDDVVLTTPKQIKFFSEYGVRKIIGFDVSPAQLFDERTWGTDLYWCNLECVELTEQLFKKTKPTVIYLSNVHEYLEYKERLKLVELMNQMPFLRTVLFCRILRWSAHIDNFIGELTERGWNVKSYTALQEPERAGGPGDIHAAVRQLTAR